MTTHVFKLLCESNPRKADLLVAPRCGFTAVRQFALGPPLFTWKDDASGATFAYDDLPHIVDGSWSMFGRLYEALDALPRINTSVLLDTGRYGRDHRINSVDFSFPTTNVVGVEGSTPCIALAMALLLAHGDLVYEPGPIPAWRQVR